jgi:hypothetical protein
MKADVEVYRSSSTPACLVPRVAAGSLEFILNPQSPGIMRFPIWKVPINLSLSLFFPLSMALYVRHHDTLRLAGPQHSLSLSRPSLSQPSTRDDPETPSETPEESRGFNLAAKEEIFK